MKRGHGGPACGYCGSDFGAELGTAVRRIAIISELISVNIRKIFITEPFVPRRCGRYTPLKQEAFHWLKFS